MNKRTFTRVLASVASFLWVLASLVVSSNFGLWAAIVFALPLIYLFAVSVRGSWKLARRESNSDFLVVLRRISGRHLKYHMLYPLAIGVLLEFVFIFAAQPVWRSWDTLTHTFYEMTRLQHIVPVLGVVLTYIVLLYRFVMKAPLIRYDSVNLQKVRNALNDATGYFALSPIRLKDWFKPLSMRYFSLLLKNKRSAEKDERGFDYRRVIVFARERDFNDALTQILDLPYSGALGSLHADCDIPLAYITQDEVVKVLEQVGPTGRPNLVGPTIWPNWIIERFNFYRLKPWIFHLDFALIYAPTGNTVIVGPTQTEKAAMITDERVRIYEKIVAEIRKATDDRAGKIRNDHDFVELIRSLS